MAQHRHSHSQNHNYIDSRRHSQTQSYYYTQSYCIQTQSYRHSHIVTQTQSHRHSHIDIVTQTQSHRHSHIDIVTQTQSHRHSHIYTVTYTQTHRHIDTQTHRHIDTQTQSHRHSHIDMVIDIVIQTSLTDLDLVLDLDRQSSEFIDWALATPTTTACATTVSTTRHQKVRNRWTLLLTGIAYMCTVQSRDCQKTITYVYRQLARWSLLGESKCLTSESRPSQPLACVGVA